MTLHSHRVYGAKRTAVLLNLTRIQNYSDIESYVVAYSISCAENIRCRLPFDRQQDLHNRVGIIPVCTNKSRELGVSSSLLCMGSMLNCSL